MALYEYTPIYYVLSQFRLISRTTQLCPVIVRRSPKFRGHPIELLPTGRRSIMTGTSFN